MLFGQFHVFNFGLDHFTSEPFNYPLKVYRYTANVAYATGLLCRHYHVLVFNIMIHYSTSDIQQSPPDIAMHLKYSTDDTDVYVDMSNGDPAQNESKVDEAMAVCHKVAADSDSVVDG